MKAPFFILLISFWFLSGCIPGLFREPDVRIRAIITDNPVDLESPKAGQQNVYLRYLSSCYGFDEDFVFTDDTLLLKVFEKNGDLYFTESLTVHSPSFQSGLFFNPKEYKIWDLEGVIAFEREKKSILFDFYDNDTLLLKPDNLATFTQDSCQFSSSEKYPVGIEYGEVSHFKAGDIELVNKKLIVNYKRHIEFLIHDEKTILVHQASLDDRYVQGWIKLN
ncbi:MAG: hypothetical protein KDE26_01720 [Bacteroidetes bacterium]|nr:hypothetical protein [Bacteroidota bacterium]